MKSILIGILVALSLPATAGAAIHNPEDAPAAFATALVQGDVRAFEPLIDDIPMSDDQEWTEVRNLVDKYDCLEMRSWRVVSKEEHGDTATLRLLGDLAEIARGAKHRHHQLEHDWPLSLVRRDGPWRLRVASSPPCALARRPFARDP